MARIVTCDACDNVIVGHVPTFSLRVDSISIYTMDICKNCTMLITETNLKWPGSKTTVLQRIINKLVNAKADSAAKAAKGDS